MRLLWIGIFGASFLIVGQAAAVELSRPYEAALAVSYGYDNSSSSGCTDYNCGSICYSGHSGSDFPLSLGTNILAAADGTVSATNNSCENYGYLGNTCGGRCGNYVQIQHSNGDFTIYCHMQRDTLTVSVGDSVSCGQIIGRSASSGSSTGPHLHLGWRPGGGSSTDVYTGSCTSSPGAWRNQGAYGEPPGGECGCVPQTEVCDGTDNNCDGTVDSGDVCEIELLHQAPHSYTRPKTTDVTGDGRQEICGRFYGGFRCFQITDEGWEGVISTSLMAESDGWGSPEYYSTIRMGDINGNGKADVCARHPDGFTCWVSTGDSFEEFDTVGWSDSGSWNRPQYYTTIRLADINGNGRHDVCARGASGWRCHLSTPDGFGEVIEGPEWSNARGYDRARYYGTIRVGDVDGDGLDDVCMRKPEGFVCYRSTGDGFEPLNSPGLMIDDNGWGNRIYWPSIRLADIDGDGTLAVCARSASELFCRRFDGQEFSERIRLGGLANDSGWSDPTNYATLRVGDVTGDGSDDLCIRANARMLCYRVDGDEVTRWDGPEWSNANGWDALASHGPLFLTNLDTDDTGALCGRSSEGLVCERYIDGEFQPHPRFDEFTDGGGWTARRYYSTIRMGQGICRADRCVEEEEEDDDPAVDPDSDVGISGDDVGPGSGSETAGSNMTSTTTTSCSAASGGPSGLVWIFAALLMGSFLVRRRRRRRRGRGAAVIVLAIATAGLLGCDDGQEMEQAQVQEPQAVEPESGVSTPGDDDPAMTGGLELEDNQDLLAVYGTWQVVGEPLAVPEGTDGPLRYRPLLVNQGRVVEWPLEVGVISEARLVGDGPDLFALGLDGRLTRVDLDEERQGRSQVVADSIVSQVTAAPDGCCVTYIRESDQGQTLHVYNLDDEREWTRQLGYSLGWAPVVAAGGEKVAWTASPQGHAAILVAAVDSEEATTIVNAGDRIAADDLDPFPRGVHGPVWTPEGIAFEGRDKLWLVDDEGHFLGYFDAEGGMFWDEGGQRLVDRLGVPIIWNDAPR